jgi:hypothetical protein
VTKETAKNAKNAKEDKAAADSHANLWIALPMRFSFFGSPQANSSSGLGVLGVLAVSSPPFSRSVV